MKKGKVLFLVVLLVLGCAGYGQAFEKGFNLDEAGQMVDLCINLNGDGMAINGVPRDTLNPADWHELFDSAEGQVDSDKDSGFGPYHNRWKLWQSKSRPDTYAIVIRGTIADLSSIKQDFIATSMDACNTTVAGKVGFRKHRGVRFTLAETPGAEVHTGFTFGLAILMFDQEKGILNQLKEKVPAGSEIFITGHSQGAALATLAHSFLHYAGKDSEFCLGDMHYQLKSYVFAQPKPGNWQYAMDFAQHIGNQGMAYTINNTYDVVPQVPLSIQLISETAGPFAQGHLIPEYLVRTLKGLRLTASNFTNRMFSTLDAVAKRFDPRYCLPEDSLRTSKGNSLDYMPVGNVMAVRSEHGDEPLPKDDQLREHHLGLYKMLLGQLASQ